MNDPIGFLGQTVRVVIFVIAVIWMISGVVNLLDVDPSNNTEAIFSVLLGALMAIAMGASFWTVRKR